MASGMSPIGPIIMIKVKCTKLIIMVWGAMLLQLLLLLLLLQLLLLLLLLLLWRRRWSRVLLPAPFL